MTMNDAANYFKVYLMMLKLCYIFPRIIIYKNEFQRNRSVEYNVMRFY